ncbi:MAG: PEP/pyruvate-binding domain-containing protein [Desulfobacteraceae bacterium]
MFFQTFQKSLALNNQVLEIIAEMGDKLSGDYIFDNQYIQSTCRKVADLVHALIVNLNTMAPSKYLALHDAFQEINQDVRMELVGQTPIPKSEETLAYPSINRDMQAVVGSKNAILAEIRNVLGLPTPDGFAITTRAFDNFFKHNNLWDKVNALTHSWRQRELPTGQAADQLQEWIRQGNIQPSLRKSVARALEVLYGEKGRINCCLALRSSAWGEDSEASFAGQYLSLLNQSETEILQGYKAILASLYTEPAMKYRLYKGFSENEVVMAVACQPMVNARISGVVFTFDPAAPEADRMLITSVWGLGAISADGRMATDRYNVQRSFPHEPTTIQVAHKKEKLTLNEEGKTEITPVPEENQDTPCLTPDQLRTLAEYGLLIEKHFKTPQDIEFAVNAEGGLFILQARPLNIKFDRSNMYCTLPAITEKFPVLLDNQGIIVQKGIAIGKVFKVQQDEDLDKFPDGAILVAKYTSPRFVKVIRKASGILTDVGSATGHMATIAREFRIPAILNTQKAMTLLQTGQEITLDADENKVYSGIIRALYDLHLMEEPIEETYEYRLLRRVLKKTSVLNLVDPSSKNFTPASCRTFHDIIRFVHEKIVEELINRQYYLSEDPKTNTVALKLAVPLHLSLVDIGGGLSAEENAPFISPEQIVSVPMCAFTQGLLSPGAWSTEPMAVDFGSFMSSMTRTFSTGRSNPKEIGQNLAVLSKQYVNISLRLGYHFNMIDAYIDDTPNNNYAYFRFFGGVTDRMRRSRRAQFLAEVLRQNDFIVDLKGDFVVARVKKLTARRMKQKLYVLGVLVGFSRQLDVRMLSDQHIHLYKDHFKHLIDSNFNPYEQGELLP